MGEIGDGIGIEVTDLAVRAVRLDHETPGQLITAIEVPVSGEPGVHQGVIEALGMAVTQLGDITGVPASIAWFPSDATLQSVDVTRRLALEIEHLRASLTPLGVSSTLGFDLAARRWLAALRWDHGVAAALARAAGRVGLVDPVVEPSPLSVGRLYQESPVAIRRWVPGGVSWQAIIDRGVAVAAVSSAVVSGRSAAAVDVVPLDREWLDPVIERLAVAQDATALTEMVADGVRRHATQAASVAPVVAGIPVACRPDGADAVGAHSVALGAAVGAAGLTGHLSSTSPVVAGAVSSGMWAVERLGDEVRPVDPRSWWRRLLQSVFGRP